MKGVQFTLIAALLLASCGSDAQTANQVTNAQLPDTSNPIGCGRFFTGGQLPIFRQDKPKAKTRVLCKRAFALLHSGVARQPLWVAELLTEENIKLGQKVPRIDNFQAEEQVPEEERAELKDYSRSGYDRGHMAPDANMPTIGSSQESFILSNISPQKAGLNRGSWADLEASVRKQTRGGPVYIVTGPLFVGQRIATTKKDNRLPVPTHFFKAVYAQDRGATVFVATNDDRPRWTTLSVNQFKQVYALNPFPALPPQFKAINGALDCTMSRIAAAASASGAAGNSSPGGASTSSTPQQCQAQGAANVKNPTSGEVITADQYRRWFGRDPRPDEYCAGSGPVGTSTQSTTGGTVTTPTVNRPGSCRANGASNVVNPTNGELITPDQYRRWFGRDPRPEEYCK